MISNASADESPFIQFLVLYPFFWKLPEAFGLELVHIPILIKDSFDFPLFPPSLSHWLNYISQTRNDEECRL